MTRRMWMAVISLAGLFIGIYLTLYHYGIVGTLACGVSSCETVQTSRYAMFLGVPVATRTLVVLGQDVVPYRRRAVDAADAVADRPKLRLNDASQGRGQQRTIKRA